MKSRKIEAVILAVGMLLLGVFIEKGLSEIAQRSRSVSVKGLSEREVPADKVTWPIVHESFGNDLNKLYEDIKQTNQTILDFLKGKGIDENEISVNAPEIIDRKTNAYGDNKSPYRYYTTSIITVKSDKVELVRRLISERGELLKYGIIITGNDYRYGVSYEYNSLNKIKPDMIEEATINARKAAEKFAKDSGSKLGKIRYAYQGQFSIKDRDANTPYIKTIRVVTNVEYSLED